MNRSILLLFLSLFLCTISVHAFDSFQRDVGKRTLQYYRDSLKLEHFATQYRNHLDSIWQSVSSDDPLTLIFPKDVEIDPVYYKLYLPVTYYKDATMQWYDPQWEPFDPEKQTVKKPLLEVNDSLFTNYSKTNRFLNRHLFDLYTSYPGAIEKWDYKIAELKIHTVGKEQLTEPKVNILDIFKPEKIETAPEETPVLAGLIKPKFWKIFGNGWIQFSQLHVSDNWYKGGENNMNLQAGFVYNFNYNNQKTLQLENTVEVKEGMNTTPSDTIHGYKINTDLFRLSSKLGIKAITNWYYTIAAQFSTQLFTSYGTNTRTRNTSLLSPAYFSASLGMDYKLNKKKLSLSVLMSPIAYELRFVNDSKVDETRFGIEKGKYALNTYGSKIESKFNWKITSYITLNSYLYAFTNYERAEMNWENTIDVAVNRYFSTKFFSHIRFDDSVNRKPDDSYFQFKDIFSFGISYNW